MPFLITRGLGGNGDGTGNALLSTDGLGDPGESVVPMCHALQVLVVESFGSYLILSFTQNLVVGGPALKAESWSIEPVSPGAVPVGVESVEFLGGPRIRLWVDEQTKDATYRITIPDVGIVDTSGNKINAPYQKTFIGFGEPVQVLMAHAVDARILQVVFSEAVVEADALNPANYTIAPALSVTRITKVTDCVWHLHTKRQIVIGPYEVTVENIRDLARNPQV